MTPVVAATGLWIAIGVLGALLIAWAAGAFLLLAMGRLTLDLRWGRSVHPLGPITFQIERHETSYSRSSPRTRAGPERLRDRRPRAQRRARGRRPPTRSTSTPLAPSRSSPRAAAPGGFRHLAGPGPRAIESSSSTSPADGTELRYTGGGSTSSCSKQARGASLGPAPVGTRRPRAPRGVKRSAEQRAAAHRAREPRALTATCMGRSAVSSSRVPSGVTRNPTGSAAAGIGTALPFASISTCPLPRPTSKPPPRNGPCTSPAGRVTPSTSASPVRSMTHTHTVPVVVSRSVARDGSGAGAFSCADPPPPLLPAARRPAGPWRARRRRRPSRPRARSPR